MVQAHIERVEAGLIYGKIIAIMRDVEAVGKNETNKDQGFQFRGVDAITNAVNPVLKKHGVVVLPTKVRESVVERFENVNKKIVTDAKIVVEFTWFAEDGSFITTEAIGAGRDFADKAVPKASSVAFRTLLIQSLALPTNEKDPDSESIEVDAPRQTLAAKLAGPSVADLQSKIKTWVNTQEVTNPATGGVAPVTSLEVDAVGHRIWGAKDAKWKFDIKALEATIAAIEAGERK